MIDSKHYDFDAIVVGSGISGGWAAKELTEKGLHHLARIRARAGTGIEVAIAPVLIGTDEKHLHTSLPALHMKRHDIRLSDARRVHRL